jgi:hypothetical protein
MTKTQGVLEVECLACGAHRRVVGLSHSEVGECPRCGYCGWAEPADLTNGERASLHRELYVRRELYKRSVISRRQGALSAPRGRAPGV